MWWFRLSSTTLRLLLGQPLFFIFLTVYNFHMNISSAYGASGILFNSNSQVPLVEGQTIKVSVLKNNGDGTCLVSFCGGKFNIKTEKQLASGDTFAADVSFVDGKVQLTPSKEMLFSSSFLRFMESNDLVPDGMTVKLLQFMEQSGFKVDKKIILRSRSVALNFIGKEKIAAEIACMLLEKGIEPTEERVRQLIFHTENPEEQDSQGSSAGEDGENAGDGENQDDEGFIEGIYSVPPVKKSGLLGFLNHLRSGETQRHWVVLPYRWDCGKTEAHGLIRILMNPELKKTEKIQINCEMPCKKYFFVLYFEESKVKEVRFCSLPPPLTSEIHNEEMRLGELFCSGMNGSSVRVTYSALAYSDGLYSTPEIPFSFEDMA